MFKPWWKVCQEIAISNLWRQRLINYCLNTHIHTSRTSDPEQKRQRLRVFFCFFLPLPLFLSSCFLFTVKLKVCPFTRLLGISAIPWTFVFLGGSLQGKYLLCTIPWFCQTSKIHSFKCCLQPAPSLYTSPLPVSLRVRTTIWLSAGV